jgi:radical SAM superfamily enzyme YgiQ (UPF0313 family)
MHIHFIFPRWRKLLEDYPELRATLAGYEIGSFRMAGLGIPAAAAAVPDGIEVTLTDEHVTAVDFDARPDLVALSYFTPQAARAHAIADHFRAAGVPVIAGGIHPSVAPDDARPHVDTLVRGPVEELWPTILDDFRQGRLARIYDGVPDAPFVQPRRELFAASGYLKAGIVQTARGCPCDCPFCVLPGMHGAALWFKPIPAVLEDIRALPEACFYFADENLLFHDPVNRRYTLSMLEQLAAQRPRKLFFLAAYPFMVTPLTEPFARLLRQAGCAQIYLVLGLRCPLKDELIQPQLIEKLRMLKELGIETMSTFTLGHDDDPADVEPLIHDFCGRIRANLAEFTIHTPFPGTRRFAELRAAGRLLTTDWERYNGAHPVFQPRQLGPDELQAKYIALWTSFYGKINRFEMNQRYARGFGTTIFEAHGQST